MKHLLIFSALLVGCVSSPMRPNYSWAEKELAALKAERDAEIVSFPVYDSISDKKFVESYAKDVCKLKYGKETQKTVDACDEKLRQTFRAKLQIHYPQGYHAEADKYCLAEAPACEKNLKLVEFLYAFLERHAVYAIKAQKVYDAADAQHQRYVRDVADANARRQSIANALGNMSDSLYRQSTNERIQRLEGQSTRQSNQIREIETKQSGRPIIGN